MTVFLIGCPPKGIGETEWGQINWGQILFVHTANFLSPFSPYDFIFRGGLLSSQRGRIRRIWGQSYFLLYPVYSLWIRRIWGQSYFLLYPVYSLCVKSSFDPGLSSEAFMALVRAAFAQAESFLIKYPD
jgi:hypothetical protein